ncbi:MAG: hypothetical protein QGF00_28010 [Planctomycetota bacterium]|nr:hypothetical protein [Planctomycetota bacterium]MDP7253475.1 hypothetical protein [Planctomycetota bacterium]
MPKQSVLAMNAHFNLIAGCTNDSVAVIIRGRYLLLVDSQTGKSMLCEDARPRTTSSVLVRPGTKEVWLTDTGEAKVFRIK